MTNHEQLKQTIQQLTEKRTTLRAQIESLNKQKDHELAELAKAGIADLTEARSSAEHEIALIQGEVDKLLGGLSKS